MTDLSTLVNHQTRLAARPVGLPTRDNWQFAAEPVADPGCSRSTPRCADG